MDDDDDDEEEEKEDELEEEDEVAQGRSKARSLFSSYLLVHR